VRIALQVESVFVFPQAEAAHLPFPKTGVHLVRRIFAMRPAFPEAVETHAVDPAGFLLFRPLLGPLCEETGLQRVLFRFGHQPIFSPISREEIERLFRLSFKL
jgi:hypothetical protein